MEAIGRLAGGIAHDFNNLLMVVNGYSEILLRRFDSGVPLDTSVTHEQLESIADAGRRASALTRQMLVVGRAAPRRLKRLCLSSVVREFEKLLHRVIGEDVTVRTVLAPDLPPVLADQSQLEQVMMNFAVNARDAMPGGGELVITTSTERIDAGESAGEEDLVPGVYAVLSASDSGTGIDPDVLPHVFDPFFTTKADGQGTGLGLSTVYGIVRQNGGATRVQSTVGEGSVFAAWFPAHTGPVAPRESRTATPPVRGCETVLVVEDDASVRNLIPRMLSHLGYEVFTAASGGECLRLLASCDALPDLLLTDVVMPGMSGPELASRVQALHPSVRVVFMSGYPGAKSSTGASETAVTEYVQKPITMGALAEALRSAVDSHPLR